MTALLVLAAAGGIAARAAEAQDELLGEYRTVAGVNFEGRHHVGRGELRSVMKTRGPSFWPWSGLPSLRSDFLRSDTLAIRERYMLHGYVDARVGVRMTPHADSIRVTVTFVIEEGERSRVEVVEFDGVHSYSERDLRNGLLLKPGRPFNPFAMQLDTLKISELYQERGFLPRVEAGAWRGEGADSLRWRVRYVVAEGPQYRVGDVLYTSGYQRVDERLVRRELLLRRDDVYRRSRMLRSGERLYDTRLFNQVQISPIADSSNARIDFELRLSERKPRWIDAGIGSGTAERFRASGEWGHRNLFGRGFQGALASRIAFDGSGRFLLSRTELSLLEPWLLRTRTQAVVTPFYERSDDRANPAWLVNQDFRGVKFELGREINRYSRVTLTQSNLWAQQDLTIFSDTLDAAVKDSVERSVVARYKANSVALGVLRDYRDNPLNAARGSMQALTLELAGGPLKGTSSFRKADFVSAWYTPIGTRGVLATRARAGVIKPTGGAPLFSPGVQVDEQVARVPLNDRFRTGGVNSVRGYGENRIAPEGGLAILQANVELRIALAGPFGLEIYVDAGNVWDRPSYINVSQFRPRWSREPLSDRDVRYVFGIGPRFNLPIGPLRLDVTWALRPEPGEVAHRPKLQFAIGPSF